VAEDKSKRFCPLLRQLALPIQVPHSSENILRRPSLNPISGISILIGVGYTLEHGNSGFLPLPLQSGTTL